MLDKTRDLSDYDLPLVEEPGSSYTLPSYLYTDPDVYEVEKEKIFYRTWQYVAPTCFFKEPGDYITCLLYTSPSPRDQRGSRMPSSA